MDDKDFYEQSKCLGMPIDFFFPIGVGGRHSKERGTGTEALERENAKFCRGESCASLPLEVQDFKPCPVLDECLERAIRNNEHGVMGGMSRRDRLDMLHALAS